MEKSEEVASPRTPSWSASLFKQTTEDVAKAVVSAAAAVHTPRPSVVYSEKDESGGKIKKLHRQVSKILKGLSNPSQAKSGLYNPEVLTSLKRQWASIQLQSLNHRVRKEPSRLFESMVVLGLHPDCDIQTVKNLYFGRKSEGSGRFRGTLNGSHQCRVEPNLDPQVLFVYPPEKQLPLKYKDILSFCFPGGIEVHSVEKTPSMSELNEILLGQEHFKQSDLSFVFRLQVADDSTLYGCCVLVEELLQKPSSLISMISDGEPSRSSSGRHIFTTRRCYCILSRLPCFELHFSVLHSIFIEERLARLTKHVSDLDLDSPNGYDNTALENGTTDMVNGQSNMSDEPSGTDDVGGLEHQSLDGGNCSSTHQSSDGVNCSSTEIPAITPVPPVGLEHQSLDGGNCSSTHQSSDGVNCSSTEIPAITPVSPVGLEHQSSNGVNCSSTEIPAITPVSPVGLEHQSSNRVNCSSTEIPAITPVSPVGLEHRSSNGVNCSSTEIPAITPVSPVGLEHQSLDGGNCSSTNQSSAGVNCSSTEIPAIKPVPPHGAKTVKHPGGRDSLQVMQSSGIDDLSLDVSLSIKQTPEKRVPTAVLPFLRYQQCVSSESSSSFQGSPCEDRHFRSDVDSETDEASFSGQDYSNEHNDVLEWAKANNHGSLQIICKYYQLQRPARGSTIKFHPLEHLQPIEYHRPDEVVRHIAGSAIDLRSCSTSLEFAEAHAALMVEEEASSLSVWAVACLCGSLRLEHILTLFSAALLEKQIVMVCSNLGILSASVLSIIPLIRPYRWQSLLMPILPNDMQDFLDAPVPYIVGLKNKTAEVQSKLTNVVLVDINKNQVKSPNIPFLPQQRDLFHGLIPFHAKLVGESYLGRKRPVYECTDVQVEAAKGFLSVLRSYLESLCSNLRSHTITNVQSNNDKVSLLLKESFIESYQNRDKPFMKLFADTQLFSVHTDFVLSFFQKE